MKSYDLRSDTVTLPSPAMRKAMHDAEVGDDVYADDPTVNRLQEMAAEITGTEAALFVSSGSMGNLIPVYLNCGRGNELLIDSRGHIVQHELASCTAIAGALPVTIPTEKGILDVSPARAPHPARHLLLPAHAHGRAREHPQRGRRHVLSAGHAARHRRLRPQAEPHRAPRRRAPLQRVDRLGRVRARTSRHARTR